MPEALDFDFEMDEIQRNTSQNVVEVDEDALWDLRNPTSMNVQQHLQDLLHSLPADAAHVQSFRKALSTGNILDVLSTYLRNPSLTLAITGAFRPLLMDLCARWLDARKESRSDLDVLEALTLLLEVQEELFPYASLPTSCESYL